MKIQGFFIFLTVIISNLNFAQKTITTLDNIQTYQLDENDNVFLIKKIILNKPDKNTNYKLIEDYHSDYRTIGTYNQPLLDTVQLSLKLSGVYRYLAEYKVECHFDIEIKVTDSVITLIYYFKHYDIYKGFFLSDPDITKGHYIYDEYPDTEKVISQFPFERTAKKNNLFEKVFDGLLSFADTHYKRVENIVNTKFPVKKYTKGDSYIIDRSNDTIVVAIKSIKAKKIVCELKGNIVEFNAEQLFGFGDGTLIFESGQIGKSWNFLRKVKSGKLNTYCIIGNIDTELDFIRRQDWPRGSFTKLKGLSESKFKQLVYDCPNLVSKIELNYNESAINDFIFLYNNECK